MLQHTLWGCRWRLESDLCAIVSRLILGFMSGCAFLSMWVQNTSAVTMVMPIVEAVLQQILKAKEECAGEHNLALQLDGTLICSLLSFIYCLIPSAHTEAILYHCLLHTIQLNPPTPAEVNYSLLFWQKATAILKSWKKWWGTTHIRFLSCSLLLVMVYSKFLWNTEYTLILHSAVFQWKEESRWSWRNFHLCSDPDSITTCRSSGTKTTTWVK